MKKHKIGTHGAVGFLTKRGLVCAECGKLIMTKSKPKPRAEKQRGPFEWIDDAAREVLVKGTMTKTLKPRAERKKK